MICAPLKRIYVDIERPWPSGDHLIAKVGVLHFCLPSIPFRLLPSSSLPPGPTPKFVLFRSVLSLLDDVGYDLQKTTPFLSIHTVISRKTTRKN